MTDQQKTAATVDAVPMRPLRIENANFKFVMAGRKGHDLHAFVFDVQGVSYHKTAWEFMPRSAEHFIQHGNVTVVCELHTSSGVVTADVLEMSTSDFLRCMNGDSRVILLTTGRSFAPVSLYTVYQKEWVEHHKNAQVTAAILKVEDYSNASG